MKEATPPEEENNVDVGYESSINDGGMPQGQHDGGTAEQETDDSAADDPSLITSSANTINGQQKLRISKRSMLALLICALISVGAFVSVKTHHNPASARDPLKSSTASMVVADGIDSTEPSKTTRQQDAPDNADAGNNAAPINGCQEHD